MRRRLLPAFGCLLPCWRRCLPVRTLLFPLLIVLPFLLNGQLIVSNPSSDALLSTQIQQLIQINAQEQLGNSTFMTEFIPRVKQTIDIANATLDTTRRLYEIGKSVADYTPEKLREDAHAGFCAAFPGTCPGLDRSLKEFGDNIEMITEGDASFWTYKSRWNNETNAFLRDLVEGSMQAYVYPNIAPDMSRYYGYDGDKSAEEVFMAAMVRSGLYSNLKYSNVQASMINMEVKRFLDEARLSKNIIARGQAIQLGIGQQQAHDLRDIALMERKRVVEEENAAARKAAADKAFLDAARKGAKDKKTREKFMDLWK